MSGSTIPARPGWRRALLAATALVALAASLLVAGAAPAAAATATIRGVASARCVDVGGTAQAPGTRTILWDCHGNANQQWTYTAARELRVYGGTRCLATRGGATADRTVVEITTCTGAATQQWTLPADGTIRNVGSGTCLDAAGRGTANRTALQIWTCHAQDNQRWTTALRTSDTTPPTAPTNPRVSGLTCNAVTFAWNASTDAVGVTAYDVYHDGQFMKSVGGSTLSTGLTVVPGATWGLYVNARDAAGNVSQASPTVSITPPQCQTDTQAPSVPQQLSGTASGTTVTLTWAASSDDVGVRSYVVFRGGTQVGTVSGSGSTPPATTFVDSGLAASTTYAYAVAARDAAGNTSARSATASVTTGAACGNPVCGVTQVATDTDIPWGLTTLPDGTVLYTRRDAHQVVRLDPAGGTRTTVGTVPGVQSTDGEGGLLGLAVAPTFSTDRWVYLMHTSPTDNRIVRMRVRTDWTLDTASAQTLLTGIGRNKYHNGGRLRFGPDGKLYIATGDAQNLNLPQDTSRLEGKVLRINPDGTIPADNPFGNAVWSYGHRNPQGLAFDSQGRLWQQEFGNSVMDETNLVVRGGNYGWPACEGTSGSCAQPGFVAPKRTYPTSEGSCSGITVVGDALYVACARGQRLYRAVISGNSLVDVQQYFVGTYGRLRTVEPAPGGALWLTTTNQGDKDSVPNNSDERILRVALG